MTSVESEQKAALQTLVHHVEMRRRLQRDNFLYLLSSDSQASISLTDIPNRSAQSMLASNWLS